MMLRPTTTISRGLFGKLSNSVNTAAACQSKSRRAPIMVAKCTRSSSGSSSPPPPTSNNTGAAATSVKYAKTTAGTGDPEGSGTTGFSTRGPVTWPALGLVAIAAASAVSYYKIERERRLENAMGKIVSALSTWAYNCIISLFRCAHSDSNTANNPLDRLHRFQVSLAGAQILNFLHVGNM